MRVQRHSQGLDLFLVAWLGLLLFMGSYGRLAAQTGHVLDAVGPVNQSMGGAGTALPLDAIGALHLNPASITGLRSSEIGFAFAAFAPDSETSSQVNAGAFGLDPTGNPFPGATLSGTTSSDLDISPMPSMGFVHRSDDSRWAYGLGGFAVGGFGVDYPASELPPNSLPNDTNPILSPQPPNGFGFGAVQSSFQMLLISVPVACQLTDKFSVGIAPTFGWSSLSVTPFAGAAPDFVPADPTDPNSPVVPVYPQGARTDARWGMGFQVGVYYEDPWSGWHLGASYTSTQWFDEFQINSEDPNGRPRRLSFDLDYPAVASLGVAYTGFDRWDIAADLRYIDYNGTDAFGPARFDANGAVTGFGWQSIWVGALGVQYHLSDHVTLRGGYTCNENPVGDDVSFFNVHCCGIVQHHLSCGFSWETPHDWIFSFSYHHGFENSIGGPWQDPRVGGPVPGTEVRSTLATHTMSGAIAKRF